MFMLKFFMCFICALKAVFWKRGRFRKVHFPGWLRFGSVRLRFGDGTVRAVPVFGSGGSSKEGVYLCVSVQFSREDGSGFGLGKTVPAVPVPRSVPGKTVPTVPVSGSGSVPGPP